ncbi:cache domain-containing sensor histidine kinase [Paenibacillus lentus]|uniref:cache domain-containing sensor histidine kinase n=1 Tax=Paenibacillus lentus TaxID=1338368 RepID=UPI0013DE47E6|nr:sensor histidine kinase [Paenibacillus lentus]
MRRWRTMFQWFGRLQIMHKIILIFLPLIFIPLFISGYLSSYNFSQSTIQNMEQSALDESKLIVSQLDSIISNAENSANFIATDINRIIVSSPEQRDSIQELRFRRQIQSKLSTDLILFPDVDSAIFIDRNNHIHTSYSRINEHEQKVFDSGMIEQVIQAGSYGINRWFRMEQRNFMVSDSTIPVLTLGKVVIDVDSGNKLGTLFINVKETTFSSFLGADKNQDISKAYLLVDSNENIISSSNPEYLLEPFDYLEVKRPLTFLNEPYSEIVNRAHGREFITVYPYDRMGWSLVNMNPMTALKSMISHNVWMTVAIGLVCLLLALLGITLLSKIIVNPLLQLAKSMRRVKDGDLSVTAAIRTQDEMGLLASVFNLMIDRIKQLIVTVENEQRRKREYELALMHAQIKPHFLYNTLDTIYVLTDMDRMDEARDTTKALADFYRIVLSKGYEIITLEEEMKIVNDYLSIMQVRYPHILQYDIAIPDELKGVNIPKLSLQPLAENAIYHGLKTKDSSGFIRIRARSDREQVIIEVEDNGVGMSPQLVSRITDFKEDPAKRKSIGIFSVHERLKLYFGDIYGIHIESKEGRGTTVKLILPNNYNKGEHYV